MKKNMVSMEVYPKTIYMDIAGMPDPLHFSFTIRPFNQGGANLWLKLELSGTNWNSNSINLPNCAPLADGYDVYYHWEDATYRNPKPSVETTDTLVFTLIAYDDGTYTTEVCRFVRNVTIVFIDSDDGSWSLDYEDDFDDASEDWSITYEAGDPQTGQTTSTTRYLSFERSMVSWQGGNVSQSFGKSRHRFRIYRNFDTSALCSGSTIYVIINFYFSEVSAYGVNYVKNFTIKTGDDVISYLGRPYDTVTSDYISRNAWYKLVLPLPADSSFTLKMVLEWLKNSTASGLFNMIMYLWIDDFKIISK